MAGKIKNNLLGRRFGMLTVVERSKDKGHGKKPVVKWNCRCDCGTMTIASSYSLIEGLTVSCGCRKIKHGESNKTRLYNIWKCMRQRCLNPKNPSYHNYGGKGVTICSEWSDYSAFKEWAISHGYQDDLSIDRINVNGNYEPDNCRWATAAMQANNTTRNHYVSLDGEMLTMAEAAEKTGLTYSAVQHRVGRNQKLR